MKITALAERTIVAMRDGLALDAALKQAQVPASALQDVLYEMAHQLGGAAEGSAEEAILDPVGAALDVALAAERALEK